jgi:hypothetical protein
MVVSKKKKRQRRWLADVEQLDILDVGSKQANPNKPHPAKA